MKYAPTIGLEIHAELKTATKMFCNSQNNPDEVRPNINVCPICLGHPGTLPTINKEAVKHVLKVGVALGGALADFTEFDRKNYFYPDIPKGYQISQYKFPLVSGGKLNNIEITRIHLEEDTATSLHSDATSSLDFNRAGVPLMELVTEPVIHSAKEAADFARELQLLLRYLGVSNANMEKGEMRVEANISIALAAAPLGTKVEVKNLNSFRAVERAIEYEIKRQAEILEQEGKIIQETRGWDDNKGETFSQRQKEESHDYRYFPEPDIPKLKLNEVPEFNVEILKKELPELPWAKRERYAKDFGIKGGDIEIFVQDKKLAEFFEAVARLNIESEKRFNLDFLKLAANYIINVGSMEKISPTSFADLIKMIEAGELSSRGAKEVLKVLMEKGGKSVKIAQELDLLQKNDEKELEKIVKKVIDDNPKVVAEYRAGKTAVLEFLVGQGMKMSKGSANPAVLRKLFMKHL